MKIVFFIASIDKWKIFAIIEVQKRKKQTKNVSILQKRGQTNAQITHSQHERGWQGAVGIQQEITERRVQKAMIPSHLEAVA